MLGDGAHRLVYFFFFARCPFTIVLGLMMGFFIYILLPELCRQFGISKLAYADFRTWFMGFLA